MEQFEQELEELKAHYDSVKVRKNGSATYVQIEPVRLPGGCNPAFTPALLVLSGQPKPQIYVKPGLTVGNGISPRSTSVVNVEGESWLQFSFNLNWDQNQHTLLQFIEGSIRRFAKHE
ncbi:MAG TPA: hypothetical protein PK068_11760 [Nitrosomonas sp.]|nr:hypothetical protein [Nitrosomonas sp.]